MYWSGSLIAPPVASPLPGSASAVPQCVVPLHPPIGLVYYDSTNKTWQHAWVWLLPPSSVLRLVCELTRPGLNCLERSKVCGDMVALYVSKLFTDTWRWLICLFNCRTSLSNWSLSTCNDSWVTAWISSYSRWYNVAIQTTLMSLTLWSNISIILIKSDVSAS